VRIKKLFHFILNTDDNVNDRPKTKDQKNETKQGRQENKQTNKKPLYKKKILKLQPGIIIMKNLNNGLALTKRC